MSLDNSNYLKKLFIDEAKKALEVSRGGGSDDTSFKDMIERDEADITLPSNLTKIGAYAFYGYENIALTSLPDGVTRIDEYAFKNCTNLSEMTFMGKPSSIAGNVFSGCTNLLTINVPWQEGAVSGAPWGATNATINYNYTGG